VLRSWDQFANLVLTSTTERYFVTSPAPSAGSEPTKLFADIPRGTYLVRGENVLLLGEIDLDKDDDVPMGYQEGEIQEVFRLKKEEEGRRKERDRVNGRIFGDEWGGEMENSGEVLF
jgi:U6 snRNA-associated Sm-like protein LSm1